MKTPIDFYWFSGTGNTLLAVNRMAEIFRKSGSEVFLHKIEKTKSEEISLDNIIGLAFPVAYQSTYPVVWNFINKLPKTGKETRIFMVDTLMAFSGGVVGPLRAILQKKGYRTIGAKEISMPNNFLPVKVNPDNNRKKVGKGLLAAEEYAHSILRGTSRWGRIPLLSDLIF
ncbi:MAG: EFR1 family ferrodoxin [Candidatus Theseobacter exili]|nr:EFR1 family ferrodoxin [Candidatus Theseobacter exili]